MTIVIEYDYTHEDEEGEEHELSLEVEGYIEPPERGDLESQGYGVRTYIEEIRLNGKPWEEELSDRELDRIGYALFAAWEDLL